MSGQWDGTAEAYDVSFARLCAGTVDDLLTSLGPADAGRTLLDVGCGPGTVAAAAHHVGFTALGVDADDSMLTLARRKHPGVPFLPGALPNLPFRSARFDAVAANFVVNHTADPRASVREMRRVTRPGGRLALTIWTGGVGPMNQLWNDVMAAASLEPPAAMTLPPAKDFERTPRGLERVLAETGLDDVAVREVSWLFRITANDLWRGVAGGVGAVGQTFRAQPPLVRDSMHNAYLRLTRDRHPDGVLLLPSVALLASATAPAA